MGLIPKSGVGSYSPGQSLGDPVGDSAGGVSPALVASLDASIAELKQKMKEQRDALNQLDIQKEIILQATALMNNIVTNALPMIAPFLQGGKPGGAPVEAVAGLPKIPGLPDIGGMLSGVSGLMEKFGKVSDLLGKLPKIG